MATQNISYVCATYRHVVHYLTREIYAHLTLLKNVPYSWRVNRAYCMNSTIENKAPHTIYNMEILYVSQEEEIFCFDFMYSSAIINQFRYKNIDLKAAALNCIY